MGEQAKKSSGNGEIPQALPLESGWVTYRQESPQNVPLLPKGQAHIGKELSAQEHEGTMKPHVPLRGNSLGGLQIVCEM